MSNNRSVIKTDGSGLTLLAVLVVHPRSSRLQRRQPCPRQAGPLLLYGSGVGHDGHQAECKPEGLFGPQSGAEQCVLILVLRFAFKYSC